MVITEKRPATRLAQVKGGLTDPQHRRSGQRAGGVEPRVVEAGDDVSRDAARLALADLREEAGHRERLVVVALDRAGPISGLTAVIRVPREATASAAARDLVRHRCGRIRIDDQDLASAVILRSTERGVPGSGGATGSSTRDDGDHQEDTPVVTVPSA